MSTTTSSFWRFANPHEFMRISGAALPPLAWSGAILMVVGIVWSLGFTPADYQQGETVKILFIHVPAAILAINTYFMMVIASLIGLIRGHAVSHLVAKAGAPIGAGFTIIAIVTGALWGQTTWGSWWEWDARLTSILVLLFFYIGYMAMWAAIEEPTKAAELAAILCLFGSVFAFLSRYAVQFWNTLHQGASIGVTAGGALHDSFFYPLALMILAHYLVFLALLLAGVRTEIRARRIRSLRLQGL